MGKPNQIDKALAALQGKRDAIEAAMAELKAVQAAKPAKARKPVVRDEAGNK